MVFYKKDGYFTENVAKSGCLGGFSVENKKIYEHPTVEVTYFALADILTTSGNIELPEIGWGQ